jgi:hypothetical protein
MNMTEICEAIESSMAFGEVPEFKTERTRRYIFVCRNNGQFHRGDAPIGGGYATFEGRFTKESALKFMCDILGVELRKCPTCHEERYIQVDSWECYECRAWTVEYGERERTEKVPEYASEPSISRLPGET